MEELAKSYLESAALISKRLSEIRHELKNTSDPDAIWHLKRRIAELTPMLTECYALEEYCRCYYDKGYYINDGPFYTRKRDHKRTRAKSIKQNKNYNGHGVNDLPEGSGNSTSNKR